jgi:hypothetical protein
MILSCVLPLLLIFVIPIIGPNTEGAFFVLVVLIFGLHLLMLAMMAAMSHHLLKDQKTRDNEKDRHGARPSPSNQSKEEEG